MSTKEQLEAENAELRDRVAELEQGAAERDVTATAGAVRPAPERPEYGLSEGERQDLVAGGVTTSPFTGEQLDAHTEGVEPSTPEARRRADKAHATVAERVPNEWPISGPPPAEGGDTDPRNAQV